MFNKRINIFTGHFGSGKTEVAVNYAMEMAKHCEKTAIVDLDIVNPYFRTADAKEVLESNGILAIIPVYANTNVDVPALPSQINMIFQKKDYKAVFDVGGDDLGARVLARYHKNIIAEDYEMFFVINTRRPMTDSVEKILVAMEEIQSSSKLKITGIINNTNVLQYTTKEDIEQGYEVIKKVSENTGIKIKFTSILKDLNIDKPMIDTEILYLNKYIHLPWQ